MNVKFSLLPVLATTALCLGVSMPAFARPATLIASDPGSQINVRSEPSTTATTPHYGVIGDRVEVLRASFEQDGYQWNYVEFASGAKGWVRGDFVRYQDQDARYATLAGNRGDRINVRSAPSTQAFSPSYGIQGDMVKLLDETQGSDGYRWHYVQFPSGTQGWVRGDLLRFADEGGC